MPPVKEISKSLIFQFVPFGMKPPLILTSASLFSSPTVK